MPTIGQFIHQRLLEAGNKGIIIADLHKERKANWKELGLTYRTGEIIQFDPYEGALIELDIKDPNQPERVWVATKNLELIYLGD